MITNANALYIPLAPRSVHMVATSPPYWGLRSYATGDNKHAELGAEKLHDCLAWARGAEPCGACYVCAMRAVGRELWRVLRDDGVWWLNLGDSYSGSGKGPEGGINSGYTFRTMNASQRTPDGLKPKDLAGIPWRVALALQADGWYLRSDIIWAKPNPMPESVTDRCTKAHEYVFMLAKSARYYYDAEAVKEDSASDWTVKGGSILNDTGWVNAAGRSDTGRLYESNRDGARRNRRSVWTIATQPYAGAHYAVWPPALVEPMMLAGTSARGVCRACGAQWVRLVERETTGTIIKDGAVRSGILRNDDAKHAGRIGDTTTTTLGWRASCDCNAGDPAPAIVLDPFCGSGTTGMVARLHGRRFVGLDLSMEYLRGQALARAEGLTIAEKVAELPLFGGLQ